MDNQSFVELCSQIVEDLRDYAPVDTGNLKYNGIRYEFNGNECIIYVDEEIAPYMPFTNEEWISPKWRGKRNPNEAWWQDSIEIGILHRIVEKVNGELIDDNNKTTG